MESRHSIEVDRLTIQINLYKEKLTKREAENRNLLTNLQLEKAKVERVRQEFINEVNELKAEVARLMLLFNEIDRLKLIIGERDETIRQLRAEINLLII